MHNLPPILQNFKTKSKSFIEGNSDTHIERKRHASETIFSIGLVLLLIAFIGQLCIGARNIYNPIDAISALFTSIGKDQTEMSGIEIDVSSQRFPRAVATIAVGMGLSVAGLTYQAIIRNPLVDPYIMGVSSGAGTFAIAAIGYGFTFFGLFTFGSSQTIAGASIIGGVLAFFITLIIAQRSGGSTNSYVLQGVIVGLQFGAIQTIMITFQGNSISNVLMWLFGSFKDVKLTEAVLILVPVILISLIIMSKSKELNLVLLGEREAKQMGLNVKKFNAMMLILASVLASFCVAFVGIIGFIGLVVPHLCRMLLGGDHRIIIPASITFGGLLMLIADISARLIMPGVELPVGAITTLIGVPVFGYLLYKRGELYNG